MSRCYGFPPPGYTRSRSTVDDDNDALIVSIKLQRENEKAISDRERKNPKSSSSTDKKEKKREKKERKKHKEKEKEKSHHVAHGSLKEKQVTTLSQNKCCVGQNESDPHEKSSVTEEHGRAIDLHKASCSSDSTGNSGKRKRTSTPPNSIQSHGNGNVLRIRLSSQKTEEQPSTSGFNGHKMEELNSTSFHNFQPCSRILREEPFVKHMDIELPLDMNKKLNQATTSISDATFQPISRQHPKLLCLSDKIAPPPLLPPPPPPPPELTPASLPEEKLSSHEKKILKRELKYKKLFGSWVPPTIPRELAMDDDGNDEDWLFGNKGGDERRGKRLKPNDSDINSDITVPCASAALQPRAGYLSYVDMYAMPFTIPF